MPPGTARFFAGRLPPLRPYHLISSPAVHASVGFLLEHRPPELGVVLASRADPPLPLARLRACGQLAELRAVDLRFTAGEAAALLQQVAPSASVALPEADVAALAARTEGWAAGLQLAALSLHAQPDVTGFVAAFTGSHRYVLDYLAEEMLERQGSQLRTFLLETSVLQRLSGPLCDAVTGRQGCQALLEQIEAAGLFLVPQHGAEDSTRRVHFRVTLVASPAHNVLHVRIPEKEHTMRTFVAGGERCYRRPARSAPIKHGHTVTGTHSSPRTAERALGAEPIALVQPPARVWRRVAGSS